MAMTCSLRSTSITWNETLFHICTELLAIHWPLEHTRRRDLANTQSGNESRCLPVAPGNAGEEALTAWAATITPRHVGRRTGFVDKNQALRVQLRLALTPCLTGRGDVWPILLGGSL